MPFGMTNSPATFQHFMNNIFCDMANIFVIVYLDNILVFSNTKEDHKDHVHQVLQCLQEHNLHAKLSKCTFHTYTIEKTKVVHDWPIL